MHRCLLLLCLMACVAAAYAQPPLATGHATIKFTSTRNAGVSAVNEKVSASINRLGEIAFRLRVRDFRFAMAEMEDHFNDNYLESDKYPLATFAGKIAGVKHLDFTRPGRYSVRVNGTLTIHNVARPVSVNGTLQVENNTAALRAQFIIDVGDYKVDTGLGGVIIGRKMKIEVSGVLRQ